MPTLRPYQLKLEQDIEASWAHGSKVVLAISPTGSGKTVTFSNLLMRTQGASAAVAHRRELVSQMSLALARNGVRHRVVGPKPLCREIVGIHMAELKRSYYDPAARCGVVGIDSLPSLSQRDPWLSQVKLWIGDEGHHFLKDNKWGRGIEMFRNPECKGALFTATGWRADGKGLGAANDGLADDMVMGPRMRELIDMGYLTDYRVVAPPSDVDYNNIPVTDSGELSPVKLRAAVHKSTKFVGDVVRHYREFATGLLACCFAVDVESAAEIATAFKAAGIPAEVISAKTPDALRVELLARFRRREITVLVNVDLFGEGFDLPALECVIMGRKTESKGLFDQQFGRVLRLMVDDKHIAVWDSYTALQRRLIIGSSSKPRGLVIDHVGNVERHLPPDAPRFHTLERRDKRARTAPSDAVPMRTCLVAPCFAVYSRTERKCPECGAVPEVLSRAGPEFVDGNLEEIDPVVLAAMCGRVTQMDAAPTYPFGADANIQQGIKNRYFERVRAQNELRDAMTTWSGWQTSLGRPMDEQYKRFYWTFKIDTLSAQALPRKEAQELTERIQAKLALDGIVKAA